MTVHAFMLLPFVGWILPIFAAVFFYRVAGMQNMSGALWATLSVVVWIGAATVIPLPLLGPALGQIGLLVAMVVVNVVRDKR